MHRSNRIPIHIYTHFPSISQRKYERVLFTCSSYVFVKRQKTFLILSITDVMPSQKKYHIFIYVSNKSDSFSLFLSRIDNKSSVCSNAQFMHVHFGPKYNKIFLYFLFKHSRIRIKLSCFLSFSIFKIEFKNEH